MTKRLGILVFAVLAMALAVSAQTPNVTGTYKVTWIPAGNSKPNLVTLADFGGVLNGIYTADSGEACPVTGTHTVNKVNFQVTCSKFTINMDGVVSLDAYTITGTYTSPQFQSGGFTMEIQTCMIPEGCKQ